MLRLTSIELVARLIPEVLLFILATYTFSNTKINLKKYILSSAALGICVFLIRMLPINYGVHTILNLIMLTIITIVINNIDIINGIKASIITSIILFICEGLNVLFLNLLYGDRVQQLISDPRTKTIYGMPSLICFAIIVISYYCFLSKRGKVRDVKNREIK